jgi:hypothetical protein
MAVVLWQVESERSRVVGGVHVEEEKWEKGSVVPMPGIMSAAHVGQQQPAVTGLAAFTMQ